MEFENDVKLYGIQAKQFTPISVVLFENDVKLYGIQAKGEKEKMDKLFENDVKFVSLVMQVNNI